MASHESSAFCLQVTPSSATTFTLDGQVSATRHPPTPICRSGPPVHHRARRRGVNLATVNLGSREVESQQIRRWSVERAVDVNRSSREGMLFAPVDSERYLSRQFNGNDGFG